METNNTIESLLRRAAVCRLLAAGFLYPGAGHRRNMLRYIADLPVGDPPPLAALERAWDGIDEDALTEEYSRLFIGADAIVLHETAYSHTGRSVELADLNGFYLAFGFDLREDHRETPDHLSVELEFYSLLLLKQAYAREQDWPDKFGIADAAAKCFLTDHLGRWTDAVRERATAHHAAPVYRLLFEAVADIVRGECQLLAVRPAPLMGSGPDFMQAASFVCPMEQASAAAPAAVSTNEVK